MLQIKNIPNQERPREKGLMNGVESLSNRELLALLIRCGTKEKSALEIADELLIKTGGLKGIETFTIQELSQVHGISSTKALELKAALELKKRMIYEDVKEKNVIENPKDLINWLRYNIAHKTQEEFIAFFLDSGGKVIRYSSLFKGTINRSLVSPREIFQEALKTNALWIIVAHNHPSGSLVPSKEDIETTKRLMECGKIMNVELVDHLIISDCGYTSIRSTPLWPNVS